MALKDYVSLLGQKAKDKVTGVTGILDSVSFDLYGCVQYTLQPLADDKGEVKAAKWLDSNRIEIIDKTHVMPVPTFEIPKQPVVADKPADHKHGPAAKPPRD